MPIDPVTRQWYPRGGVPPLSAIPRDIQATGALRTVSRRQISVAGDEPYYWAGAEEGYAYDGIGVGALAAPLGVLPPAPALGTITTGLYPERPVGFNGILTAGMETDGLAEPGEGVLQTAWPLAIAGGLTLGLLRSLWTKFGATAIRALVGAGVFAAVMKLILGDDSDDRIVDVDRLKRRRRYTIGANPRVRTLQKVSRHCQRLLKRHEKVIREFLPKKTTRYGIPPSRALSPIEKAAIRG